MTRNPTMWTTGVAIISAVMLAWSPVTAATPKGDAKLAEARRKAMASAARQSRKTMKAEAQQQRKTARVEGRQDRKAVAARADAAATVARAQAQAARAKAAARRAPARRPVVVVKAPRRPARSLPRIGANVRFGGHDKSWVRFGLDHRSRYTWIAPCYVTRTERVLVDPGHYEWRTEPVLIEPGHFEPQHVGPTEEIIYDSQGNPHKVIVTPTGREKVWVEARYETRRRKVWVPDLYELREVRVRQPGRWVSSSRPGHSSGFSLSALFKF